MKYKKTEPIFTKRINQLIKESNVSISQISQATTLSIEQIKKLMAGKRPIWIDLICFAKYFNTSCDYLLGLSENRNKKTTRQLDK